MIYSYGTNSAVESLDDRAWSGSPAGCDMLSTSFKCKSAYAVTNRDSLISNGHPSFPGLRTKLEDTRIEDAQNGIARITATFSGIRSATSFTSTTSTPARVTRCRPINSVQAEYEIRTMQNYLPKLDAAYSLLIAEIPSATISYPLIAMSKQCTESYLMMPVLESFEATQVADSLYDCTYYVTTREVMNSLSGITMKLGYNTGAQRTGPLLVDVSQYFPNIPTVSISLSSDLTLGRGLDRLATERGKNIRFTYTRFRNPSNEIEYDTLGGIDVAISPQFYKYPPRILLNANVTD